MNVRSYVSILFMVLAFAPLAPAAPHRLAVQPRGLNSYIHSGVVVGGASGKGFSILRIQTLLAPDGAERVVIVYGDANGKPVKGRIGFFHISVDERTSRVSIDLAQVQKTAVDGTGLKRVFKDSRMVASTEITMDPVDLSTNISLTLTRPAEVKTSVDSQNGAKMLIIDLRPVTTSRLESAAGVSERH